MNNICYWLECDDGYWEPGCYRSHRERLISFPDGKGPVVSCKGVCPNCGNPVFEKQKRNPEVDDFIMEMNLREFHK